MVCLVEFPATSSTEVIISSHSQDELGQLSKYTGAIELSHPTKFWPIHFIEDSFLDGVSCSIVFVCAGGRHKLARPLCLARICIYLKKKFKLRAPINNRNCLPVLFCSVKSSFVGTII